MTTSVVVDLSTESAGAAAGPGTAAVSWPLTSRPRRSFAVADAVLVSVPALTSTWVIVRVPVQTMDLPTPKVVTGSAGVQARFVSWESVTLTLRRVTLPVFVAVTVKRAVSPTVSNDAGPVLTTDSSGRSSGPGTVAVPELSMVPPCGSAPVAVAVLRVAPESTSSWVVT